jgi:hypothetical protein
MIDHIIKVATYSKKSTKYTVVIYSKIKEKPKTITETSFLIHHFTV